MTNNTSFAKQNNIFTYHGYAKYDDNGKCTYYFIFRDGKPSTQSVSTDMKRPMYKIKNTPQSLPGYWTFNDNNPDNWHVKHGVRTGYITIDRNAIYYGHAEYDGNGDVSYHIFTDGKPATNNAAEDIKRNIRIIKGKPQDIPGRWIFTDSLPDDLQLKDITRPGYFTKDRDVIYYGYAEYSNIDNITKRSGSSNIDCAIKGYSIFVDGKPATNNAAEDDYRIRKIQCNPQDIPGRWIFTDGKENNWFPPNGNKRPGYFVKDRNATYYGYAEYDDNRKVSYRIFMDGKPATNALQEYNKRLIRKINRHQNLPGKWVFTDNKPKNWTYGSRPGFFVKVRQKTELF